MLTPLLIALFAVLDLIITPSQILVGLRNSIAISELRPVTMPVHTHPLKSIFRISMQDRTVSSLLFRGFRCLCGHQGS